MNRLKHGNILVSTLVAVALMLGLAVFFVMGTGAGSKRKDGLGKTVPGAVRAQAFDTECKTQLSQIRQSISIATNMGEDANPSSLSDLRLGADFLLCPIGKEPFAYDSATGKVQCVHLGHEAY